MRVEVAGVAAYLPPTVWTSAAVEERIRAGNPNLRFPNGAVAAATGIHSRRYAADHEQSSDLAATAARRVLAKTGVHPRDIDLLVFASASQDLVEPATANIVQEKTGTSCPVFDLKNACNSFLSALSVAEALILTGAHRNVLVTSGEMPSRGINWHVKHRREFKDSFIGYTLGDAGAAALLRPGTGERGILYRSFQSVSRHWDLATLPGGGTMHPRGDEWATFRGDGKRLKEAFKGAGAGILERALSATETRLEDVQRIFVHQVSVPVLDGFMEMTRAPRDRIEVTVCEYGNMAAASLPVAFAQAEARGAVQPGDLTLWVGLAAGLSLGVMFIRV